MSCGIRQNDIGTEIRVQISNCSDVPIDISTCSSKEIIFKKPNGTLVTKSASFVTDGADGLIYYTIESGDLDTVGTWKIQAVVSFGSYDFHSNFESFRVYRNLT